MNEATIITLSPQLGTTIRKKKQAEWNDCLRSYLNMVKSMACLPEEMLVEGAYDYARRQAKYETEDVLGNAWLQALSLKNEEMALSVREVIDNELS